MLFKRIVAVFVIALCSYGVRAQTFPCDNGSRLYFFQDTLTNGSLSYVENYLTIPTITRMCTLPTRGHNGLGANPVDHYLYYLDGSTLHRLDANCNVTPACTLASSSLYGCFDPKGRYWTVQSNSLVAIDIGTCSIVKGPYPITGSGFLDIAFNPFDCYIYVNDLRYDTTGTQDLTYSGVSFTPGGTYGGVAIGSDGNLYGMAGTKNAGNLSKINLTTSTSTNIFNFTPGPVYARSDMASFPCYSVNAHFSASTISGCSSTVSFTDSSLGPVGLWQWNFGDPLSGTSDTSTSRSPTHIFSGAGTYTVTLTVSMGGNYCLSALYSDSSKLTLTVGSGSMIINAGPDVTICSNDSVQLNVAGAPASSTVTWRPAVGLSCTNCSNPVASPSAATSYVVSVIDAGGCSGSDTVIVNVVPPLVLDFPRNYYLCGEGTTSVVLTASGGTSYLWSPSATLSDSTIADPLATPTATTTYTVMVSNGSCFDTAQVTVHLVSLPVAPTITQKGDTILVPPSYASYQWYKDGSPIPGAVNYFYVPTQAGYYSVLVTDIYGCRVITSSAHITLSVPSILSEKGKNILIYPNPGNGKFLISGVLFYEKTTINVFDILGQLVYTNQIQIIPETNGDQSEIQIDVSYLSKGIYILNFSTSGHSKSIKIVIQ